MTREESRRLIQGPIATLPTPMDERYSLDLGVMAELTRWWVESGLTKDRAPIKVAAAMGEGPDLADDEWPELLRTVVDAAGPDAAVICALKPKNVWSSCRSRWQASSLTARSCRAWIARPS